MLVGSARVIWVVLDTVVLSLAKGFVHMLVSPWLQTNVETGRQ
jgi:hypothetical protein